jgi:PAS domain S-box-containing protein
MSRSARTPRQASQARLVKQLEARNLELARTLQLVEEVRANLADQYDFAPIGFVTLDVKGCIREINLTAARMLGRERSRLLTMPFFTHVAKPDCRAFLNHLRGCRTTQSEIITDVALRAGRSQMLAVELRSVPVIDSRRGDIVYRTAITDITGRVRAANALRESEERYRDLVEFSPDGIFVERDGEILFANSAALRLCGVETARDMVGSRLVDWVGASFRQAFNSTLLASTGARETPTMEIRLLRPDGIAVEVEMAAHRFLYEGEPAMLVLARDITRRKKAERDVLEISGRERANFGREVHDGLCQSLVGVAYLAHVLQRQVRGLNPRAAAAGMISGIVRQCADEARTLARGIYPVAIENNGLAAALHILASGVKDRARARCTLECDDHLSIGDAGVATHLYRIAQEAVSNALRHGKPKNVLIQLLSGNGDLTLRVSDDGKGLPAKPSQSGMGLHTMLYRATTIGGSLDIRRSHPRGTVVTCSIPANGILLQKPPHTKRRSRPSGANRAARIKTPRRGSAAARGVRPGPEPV